MLKIQFYFFFQWWFKFRKKNITVFSGIAFPLLKAMPSLVVPPRHTETIQNSGLPP